MADEACHTTALFSPGDMPVGSAKGSLSSLHEDPYQPAESGREREDVQLYQEKNRMSSITRVHFKQPVQFAYRGEALPVDGGGAVFAQGCKVRIRTVAFVLSEAV